MEKNDSNKSMCEELYGGKLEVTVVPNCFEKSDTRRQKNGLYMFLPIREGIAEVLHKLKQLCEDTEHTEGWAKSFGNELGRALGREMKLTWTQIVKSVRNAGGQTSPQIVVSSTPYLRKRPRELAMSPQDTTAKRLEMKRPEASRRERNGWRSQPGGTFRRKSLNRRP